MKIRVRCSVYVEVDVPDDWTPEQIEFDLVENHCPGTGRIGAVIDAAFRECGTRHTCWACHLFGENEIVEPLELVKALRAPYMTEE